MTSCKYLIAFLMVVAKIQDVHAVQPSRYDSIQPLPFVVPAAWPDALDACRRIGDLLIDTFLAR